jgi:hypothetical protein
MPAQTTVDEKGRPISLGRESKQVKCSLHSLPPDLSANQSFILAPTKRGVTCQKPLYKPVTDRETNITLYDCVVKGYAD